MKFKSFLFLILAVSPARGGTVSGTLQGPSGISVKNATLTFTLEQAGLAVGTGAVVPLAASCYTSTDGTVVGIPNPAANISSSIDYGSGALPGGIYYVQTTFYGGSQETLPSPELRVQLTAGGTLMISPPWSVPPNIAGMKVYIGTASGGEQYQGETASSTAQFAQALPLATGVSAPLANSSVCSIAFNDTIIPYSGYSVSLISSSGNPYPGWPQAWQLNGGLSGTINISDGAPLWNGVTVYPQPIVAQPLNHGPQSIAGALNLSGYNLAGVGALGVGTSLPAYPIDVENGAINASAGYLYASSGGSAGQCLVSDGTAFVPGTCFTPGTTFYQSVEDNADKLPQEAVLKFGPRLQISDEPGLRTTVDLALSGVSPGSYTNSNITVDGYGRVTAATSGAAIPTTKVLVVTSGICTTANSAYSTCSMTENWPSAFIDAAYAATCTPGAPSASGSTPAALIYVTAKSASGITLEIQNGDTTAAGSTTLSEIDCIGVRP